MDILKLLGLRSTSVSNAPSWVKPDLEKARRARSDAELVVLLSNRNGYVREEAIIRAAELLLPTVLPHLMPRINDWVSEVRLAAHKAVEAYLLADKFDDLLNALPSIYWLRCCRREDHTAFIERMENFLVEHRRASEIPVTLTKRTGIHARSLFDLSWKFNLAPKSELIRLGLASKDVPTTRRACRAIYQLPESEHLAFGKQLLQEKSGWLRYDGLRIVSKYDLPAAKLAALASLLAEYAPLRELAEKLTNLTQQELSLIRQEALRSKEISAACIRTATKLCGILKDKNCETLLEGFLQHEHPTFRGVALLALTRISPGKYNDKIFEFLYDEASAVSHNALLAFSEGDLEMPPDQWKRYAQSTQSSGHFQRLSALARRINKWEHLGVLLEFAALNKFSDLVNSQISTWRDRFNHSFLNYCRI